MSLFDFLRGAPKEELETARLIREANVRDGARMVTSSEARSQFVVETLCISGDRADLTPGDALGGGLCRLANDLLSREHLFLPIPASKDVSVSRLSLQQGAQLRTNLRSRLRYIENEKEYLSEWRETLSALIDILFSVLPPHLFVDPDESGNFDEISPLVPHAPLYSFLPDAANFVEHVVCTILSSQLDGTEVFAEVRGQLYTRLCLASGIDDSSRKSKPFVMPTEKRGLSDEDLIELYLAGTPFFEFMLLRLPLYIPEALRFEHTHIIAGTGHGKTQTLQYLIASDLARDRAGRQSLVVMDSQGDLLDTLMRSPLMAGSDVRERFIYVNPMDLDLPIGLNLFDSAGFAADADPIARETILNGTVELYEYFFSALIGAELTQKQGVVFRYIAHLLVHIPGASIHTLRELMEDGRRFMPYMQALPGSARVFFETRFFDRTFSETKKQVLTRLFGVLANQALDRMMGSARNSVDLFRALQNGSIVFINTAKDFLGHEGSAIFSRMFIALLGQALIRRASLKKHERTPTYIYIDEAQDTVDLTLTRMLSQVRKYKGAITFAHQNLDQLAPEIRAGVIANTSIKLAGGLSAKDANALAADFRVDSAFLLGQRKGRHETSFACFAKNVTERAISLPIPLGFVEGQGRPNDQSFARLVFHSRAWYGVKPEALAQVVVSPPAIASVAPGEVDVPAAVPVAPASPNAPPVVTTTAPLRQPAETLPSEDRDPLPVPTVATHSDPAPESSRGAKHKYLQHLVKELGEARGFRATLEQPVHDGAGRVDVVLVRDEVQIAFEVSVTTTKDHELGNIEKCLALPFTYVVMLASHARHLKGLQTHIRRALDEADARRVQFLLPEELPALFESLAPPTQPGSRVVKGYAVRSKVKVDSTDDATARRRAVAKVVAGVAHAEPSSVA